jgi:hypothetical protein
MDAKRAFCELACLMGASYKSVARAGGDVADVDYIVIVAG